jgi:hypothetical protein
MILQAPAGGVIAHYGQRLRRRLLPKKPLGSDKNEDSANHRNSDHQDSGLDGAHPKLLALVGQHAGLHLHL